MKQRSIINRIIGAAVIPAGTLLIFVILCALQGTAFVASAGHLQLLARSVATVTLTSYALSLNLNSGRFDFSLGSIALLSSVISASLTLRLGLGPAAMLAISFVAGLALGAVSGLLYVVLRLPAIITSLGVTLLYEALAFILTDGKGVSFGTYPELTAFSSSIPNMVIVTVLAALFMTAAFDHSLFGYHYSALQHGQRVSVHTGIHERSNAVACYTIAGAMMGIEGYIAACLSGTITMSLNFGSISVMFTAFLPMFIGGFIGRFINRHVGMVLGAMTSAFISLGFVRLGLATEVQSLVSAFILVLFLIYLNNETTILGAFRRGHKEVET